MTEPSNEPESDHLHHLVKSIADLDGLLSAIKSDSRALPSGLPPLADSASVQMQVLRMSLMIDRPWSEVVSAAEVLRGTLEQFDLRASKTRVDATTRAGVRLAKVLARAILSELERESGR